MKRRVKYDTGITIRFPDDVLEAVYHRCEENDRSVNWQVVALLRVALNLPAPRPLYEREQEREQEQEQ